MNPDDTLPGIGAQNIDDHLASSDGAKPSGLIPTDSPGLIVPAPTTQRPVTTVSVQTVVTTLTKGLPNLLTPVQPNSRVYADYLVDVVLAVCATVAFCKYHAIEQSTWQMLMTGIASGRVALRFLSRKNGNIEAPATGAAVAIAIGALSFMSGHKRA